MAKTKKQNSGSNTYASYAEQRAKKSNLWKDCVCAFLVGGLICTFGELLKTLYTQAGLDKESAGTLVSVTLVFLTAFFTGIGWFDSLARIGGAGTLVPITGFANSVVSPALDNKAEGMVLGLGAKIFIIAGPVILYGTLASAVYGVIYYLVRLFIR